MMDGTNVALGDVLDTAADAELDQSEIDKLFGFEAPPPVAAESGVQALLQAVPSSHERLPMLDVVFDRLTRSLSTALRNFTLDNTEVVLESVASQRFGDFVGDLPLPSLLAIARVDAWDNFALVASNSNLIYSIVDCLLGGRRSASASRIDGRPFTTIEVNLVSQMKEVILAELGAAFTPVTPVSFKLDRMESSPRFATIARDTNIVSVAQLRVQIDDRGGRFWVVLPHATLEPVRDRLLQRFIGEKFGHDLQWEESLRREGSALPMTVEAVIESGSVPLSAISPLEPGQVLPLRLNAGSPVALEVAGVRVGAGRLGRSNDHVAIRVDRLGRNNDR